MLSKTALTLSYEETN